MGLNKKFFEILDYDLSVMQINTRNIARYGIDEKESLDIVGKKIINLRSNMFL